MNLKKSLATLMALACVTSCMGTAFAAPTDVTLNSGTGNGSADTHVVGIVAPITQMDVTVPLNVAFKINADRSLSVFEGTIQSDTAAPLGVKITAVDKLAVADNITLTAPTLRTVEESASIQWNDLSVAKTKDNIHIKLNEADLAAIDKDDSGTAINIGYIKSAYGEDDQGNYQATPQYMDLDLSEVKYGKAWGNTTDLVFGYNTTLEFYVLDTDLADGEFTSYDTSGDTGTHGLENGTVFENDLSYTTNP